MYLEHFGLREEPFALTTDPRFLFLSPAHEQAQACLEFAALKGDGIVVITGAIGAGKSMLAHDLATRAANEVIVAHNTRVGATGLLQEIFAELGHQDPPDTKAALLLALRRELAARFEGGTRTVVLVDEAQHLDAETLEELRMLADEQVGHEKPMSVILVGQPTLEDTLNGPGLEQVRQRVRLHFYLPPLTLDDTERYLAHRLCVASKGVPSSVMGRPNPAQFFDRAAVIAMHRYTGGVPRLINVVADLGLMAAWMEPGHVVTAPMIEAAVADLGWTPYWRRRDIDQRGLSLAARLASLPAVALAGTRLRLGTLRQRWLDNRATRRAAAAGTSRIRSSAAALQATVAPLHAKISGQTSHAWTKLRDGRLHDVIESGQAIPGRIDAVLANDDSRRIVAGSAAVLAVTLFLGALAIPGMNTDGTNGPSMANAYTMADTATDERATSAVPLLTQTTPHSADSISDAPAVIDTPQVSLPESPQVVSLHDSTPNDLLQQQGIGPAPATKPLPVAALPKTPATTPIASAPNKTPAVTPVATSAADSDATIGLPSAPWLLEQSPDGYVIQVFATHQPDNLSRFADTQQLDQMAWYHRRRDNQDWYVLIAGQYPTYDLAMTASASLPPAVRRNKPWVRKMALVQADIRNNQM